MSVSSGVSHWKPSVVTPPSNRRLPNCRGKLVKRRARRGAANVQAMKHLEIRSTVIATAHKETINHAVKKYYEDGGREVLSKGLEVSKPVEQVKLPDYASFKVAARALSAVFKDRQSSDARKLALSRVHS